MGRKLKSLMVQTGVRCLALSLLCVGVSSCSSTTSGKKKTTHGKEYFSESAYGVKASPRMVSSGPIPKGGGRFMVGKPYQVAGKTYVPKDNPSYDKVGMASWYGSAFHGRQTANGELYDQGYLSAAHPTLPLPSYARVTNIENGSSVIVRINDRGPFHSNRLIDLSSKTAELLDMQHSGTAKVRVQYVGQARMDGHDMPYLMASYTQKGERFPQIKPEGQIASGVMVASNVVPGVPQPNYASNATSMQTSLAGPTPSAGAGLAFGVQQLQPPGIAAFEQFATLPEFGPQLIERPLDGPGRGGSQYASAYAEIVPTSNGDLAFDAILVRNDSLNETSIKAYAERRLPSPDTGR
ncbi:MAG: septal ring lytic transglycosylase RlpA family protein [Allorhizobium sp.]